MHYFDEDLANWMHEMIEDHVWPQLKGNQHRKPQWTDIDIDVLVARGIRNAETANRMLLEGSRDDAQIIKELTDCAIYCLFAIHNITGGE